MGQIGSTMVSVCAIGNTPINAVSDNIIAINCAIWPKERTVQCQIRTSLGAPYELIKNTDVHVHVHVHVCTVHVCILHYVHFF